MAKYRVKVKLTKFMVLLVYFYKIYKVDFLPLLFLWNKYGRDLFYVFFMFANRKFTVPKMSKLLRMVDSSKSLYGTIKGNTEYEPKTEQEKVVLAELKKMFDGEGSLIVEGDSEFEQHGDRNTDEGPNGIFDEEPSECGKPA